MTAATSRKVKYATRKLDEVTEDERGSLFRLTLGETSSMRRTLDGHETNGYRATGIHVVTASAGDQVVGWSMVLLAKPYGSVGAWTRPEIAAKAKADSVARSLESFGVYVFVDPSSRRRGIGRSLVRRSMRLARETVLPAEIRKKRRVLAEGAKAVDPCSASAQLHVWDEASREFYRSIFPGAWRRGTPGVRFRLHRNVLGVGPLAPDRRAIH